MEHQQLAQVTLRMQSTMVRTALRKEIQQFEKSFDEIIQQTGVFLATTEQHFMSPSLVVTDEDLLIRHLCGFLVSKLSIEGFLAFHQQTIQRTSGGDTSLAKQVKAATVFVQELLVTLICHKEAADYPGKHLGMMGDQEVKYFGGTIFHLNPHIGPDDELPEIDDVYEDIDELTNYYHAEKLSHPLRQLPGTPWHKFFGNFPETRVHDAPETSLFRENPRHEDLTLSIPGTILFLIPEFRREYKRFRELLEEHSQLSLPLLLDEARKENLKIVQRRLSHIHEGHIECGNFEPLCREHTDMIPRPEYDLDGNRKFEMQNLTVNTPELIGDSLPDGRIAHLPIQLEGVPAHFVTGDEDE
ncbi:sporulation minus regulator 1 [Apiosordaria backusii]|uniref:Sporulation minus regulator 1 n=1 Tax=Apiosordaria backusii TaxID=314023 RepID=A0AA40E3J4_9PEZI|nr:sporulation minus regulator 1 [Apiosordaria backusii]